MTGLTRRAFLLLTGGAGAAASLEPGRKLVNKLIPYVNQPQNIIPGEIAWFATTCRECPAGCGMIVAHRDGRVTKAEGNSAHPVNRGGLCPRGQASLQGLYDPDRLTKVIKRSNGVEASSSWDEAYSLLATRLREKKGRLVIISRPETGSLHEVLTAFAAAFGGEAIYHDRLVPAPLLKAHEVVYGQPFIPHYNLAETDYLLTFGADFLETWISPVRFARDFAEARRRSGNPLRHVFIGPRRGMTAANADEFIPVSPEERRNIAGAVLSELIESGQVKNPLSPAVKAKAAGYRLPLHLAPGLSARLAAELVAARRPLVLPGPSLPDSATETELAVLVSLINTALGNPSVDLSRREAAGVGVPAGSLVAALQGLSPHDTVLIFDDNIAFTSPETAGLLSKAGLVVYAGTLPDETSELAHLVLPLDHFLESWGDYQPTSGVESLLQPVMGRLFETVSAGDILIRLAKKAGKPLLQQGVATEFLENWLKVRWQEHHRRSGGGTVFDNFWSESLANGFVTGGGMVPPPAPILEAAARRLASSTGSGGSLVLFPFSSIMLYDGRMGNRGWLQEAPDPVTTAVWGDWAEIHPATAEKLGVKDGELVEIGTSRGKATVPLVVTDGVDQKTVALLVGQGHTARKLSMAKGIGVNSFILLGGGNGEMVTVRKAGKSGGLVRASATDRQHNRKILQWLSANILHRLRPGEGEKIRMPMKEGYERNRDVWSGHDHNGHRWGMVIDLDRCIGCGACAVACQAENNIPVVGKKAVSVNREMAWLKVTPYRDDDGRRVGWLPILCQHCDAAPCEPVCPVYAAVHNEEGLNAQVYNRCIGTRYCANNCPYKVRRFNWFDQKWRYPLDLQLNPDVTVRARGVMEKCTFCVQRIRAVELTAAREGRPVRDGEIQTACSQSCPTRAIIFGDLMDTESQVLKLMKEDPRRYQLLESLNTKPAVVYLKRVVNDPQAKG